MEDFLRKLKLIDEFSVELNVPKTDFVKSFRNHVDQEDIDSIFSGFLEVFTSSKNLYKGLVNHNGFKIRKRRRFFDRKFGYAKASGNYTSFNDKLLIDVKITAWNNFMYIFFGIFLILYAVLISVLISSNINEAPIIVPFIILHAVLMFGIPYFIMRRGVVRIKEDLEREFYFIVSKLNNK